MNEQIKQDIDLIEILFYLKKKIRVILFIIAICMAMVLLDWPPESPDNQYHLFK